MPDEFKVDLGPTDLQGLGCRVWELGFKAGHRRVTV